MLKSISTIGTGRASRARRKPFKFKSASHFLRHTVSPYCLKQYKKFPNRGVNAYFAQSMQEQTRGAPADDGQATFPSKSETQNESNLGEHHSAALTGKYPLFEIWKSIYQILTWVPPNCRWDPDKPPKFSFSLNLLFSFAACFTVANLYYNHPILNILAHDFDVPYEKVAQIPTVVQAGYAAGLLFLCPLGDLF